MAEPVDVDPDDLPPMLSGESRTDWVARIEGSVEEKPAPPAKPFDPDEYSDVRQPFKES